VSGTLPLPLTPTEAPQVLMKRGRPAGASSFLVPRAGWGRFCVPSPRRPGAARNAIPLGGVQMGGNTEGEERKGTSDE
jgi:hypothetical protein